MSSRISGAMAFLLFVPAPAKYGQTSTGELSGTVTDTSGAVVTNAQVSATSTETTASRESRTDQNGAYVIAGQGFR